MKAPKTSPGTEHMVGMRVTHTSKCCSFHGDPGVEGARIVSVDLKNNRLYLKSGQGPFDETVLECKSIILDGEAKCSMKVS